MMLKALLLISLGFPCLASRSNGCPQLKRLPNGNVQCTRSNHHGSRCSFVCNGGFELGGGSGSVMCRNGRWFKGRTNTRANLAVLCVSTDLGRVASGNDECSSRPCGYPGINEEMCQEFAGCCWNEARSSCSEVARRLCGYRGIPSNLCSAKGCDYNVEEGNCYKRTSFELPPTINARSSFGRSSSESSCHPGVILRNSRIDCASRDDNSFRCEISCDVGFFLVGESFYICNNGNSENFTLDWECRKISCPAMGSTFLQSRHNASEAFVSCTDEWNVGSLCSLQCPEHHVSRGASSLKCMSNGQWERGTYVCQEIPKCDDLTTKWPRLGWGKRLFLNCSREYYIGGKCRFKCAKGFRLQGSVFSKCVEKPKRRWTNKPPQCIRATRNAEDGCNFKANLRTGRILPNRAVHPHIDVTQVLVNKNTGNSNPCSYKGSIEIDFTRMKNVTLRLTYSNPKGSHIQIGTGHYPSLMKGYYRFGFRSNNLRRFPLPLRFTRDSQVSVTFHKAAKPFIILQKGREKNIIPFSTWNSKPKINVYFNQWENNVAPQTSGLCEVCVSYEFGS